MFKRILQSIFTRLGVSFINLLVLLISSRYLGVSSRGEISLFLFNISVLQIIAEIVTGYHLLHFTKGNVSRKIYGFGLLTILVISSAGNLFFYSTHKLIAGFEVEALVLTFLVLLNTFHCILLLCGGKLNWFNRLGLFQPLLFLLVMLVSIFFFSDYTLSAFILPLIFAFAISSLLSGALLLRSTILDSSGQELNILALVKNGLAGQAALLLFVLGNKLSYYFLPVAQLGLYASTCQIAESLLVPVNALLPVYFAEKLKHKSGSAAPMQLQHYLGLSLWFCLIGLLILNLVPDSVYLLLLGDGFKGIKNVLLMYSSIVPLLAIYLLLSNYYSGQGQSLILLKNNLSAILISLVLTPVLVPLFQISGAVVVAFLTYFVLVLRLYLIFIRTHHLRFFKLFDLAASYRILKQS